jgi:hypothetical protein
MRPLFRLFGGAHSFLRSHYAILDVPVFGFSEVPGFVNDWFHAQRISVFGREKKAVERRNQSALKAELTYTKIADEIGVLVVNAFF